MANNIFNNPLQFTNGHTQPDNGHTTLEYVDNNQFQVKGNNSTTIQIDADQSLELNCNTNTGISTGTGLLSIQGEAEFKEQAFFNKQVNLYDDVIIAGKLAVSGETWYASKATFEEDVIINDDVTIKGELTVTGKPTFGQEATFEQEATFQSSVEFDSAISLPYDISITVTQTDGNDDSGPVLNFVNNAKLDSGGTPQSVTMFSFNMSTGLIQYYSDSNNNGSGSTEPLN